MPLFLAVEVLNGLLQRLRQPRAPTMLTSEDGGPYRHLHMQRVTGAWNSSGPHWDVKILLVVAIGIALLELVALLEGVAR